MLRIDDLEEVVKSLIWEILGIKKDEKIDIFRVFRLLYKVKSCFFDGKFLGR